MASVINEIHGAIMKPFIKATSNTTVSQITVGPATYAWRARILLNRLTSLKEQAGPIVDLGIRKGSDGTNLNTTVSKAKAKVRAAQIKVPKPFVLDKPTVSTIKNQIVIINPNVKVGNNGYQSLVIQGMPTEVNCEFENSWVAVRNTARNNPFYIYTGSEDTISFDISWYSIQPDRKDVIKKCRLLESWSKSNGYNSAPPELWLSWGSAELFKDFTFILVSAPYILGNFQNAYRLNRKSNIVDLGLLPNAATQKLTFKRVTKENLTHEEIQKIPMAQPVETPNT